MAAIPHYTTTLKSKMRGTDGLSASPLLTRRAALCWIHSSYQSLRKASCDFGVMRRDATRGVFGIDISSTRLGKSALSRSVSARRTNCGGGVDPCLTVSLDLKLKPEVGLCSTSGGQRLFPAAKRRPDKMRRNLGVAEAFHVLALSDNLPAGHRDRNKDIDRSLAISRSTIRVQLVRSILKVSHDVLG